MMRRDQAIRIEVEKTRSWEGLTLQPVAYGIPTAVEGGETVTTVWEAPEGMERSTFVVIVAKVVDPE
jgi:hypothetical protein